MCMWARELHISHYRRITWNRMAWNEMNTVESINSSTMPRYAMHKILSFKFLVLNPIKRTQANAPDMRTKVNKMWNYHTTTVAAALCLCVCLGRMVGGRFCNFQASHFHSHRTNAEVWNFLTTNLTYNDVWVCIPKNHFWNRNASHPIE